MRVYPNFGTNKELLLPAISQDIETNQVLMLAFVNHQAFEETLSSGYATFWSRSRNLLWKKGETSGNLQLVQEVLIDCDQDSIIYRVKPLGPACHTGEISCFFQKI